MWPFGHALELFGPPFCVLVWGPGTIEGRKVGTWKQDPYAEFGLDYGRSQKVGTSYAMLCWSSALVVAGRQCSNLRGFYCM